jgi:hypothetical protein
VKKSKWRPWSGTEKSDETRFDKLKAVRRQTDQRLKQQDARKNSASTAKKK